MREDARSKPATESNFRIIFSIAFVSFMVSLDTYIVNISLPTISRHFGVGTDKISWVVLAYLLAVTGTLLIFGRLGDRIGLKRVFVTGFWIFTFSSLLCGLSTGIYMLVLSRFLQGVGGSMLLGMAPAMIPRFLPPGQRGTAFGYYSTAAALGIILGTPLGGIITGYASWHWIFLINIPTGLLAIWYCHDAIPSDSPGPGDQPRDKFDSIGAVSVFTGFSTLIYSLNMGNKMGWTSPIILTTFFGGLFLLIFFLLWEMKTLHPLMDLGLFRDRAFTFGNLASCFAVAFQSGSNFLMPFYLERFLGLKPQVAGLVILVYAATFMAGSLYAGKLSDRVSPRLLCTWAMVIGAVASGWFALTLKTGQLIPVIVFLVALGVAYALFIPSNNNLVLGMAPRGKHGVVSGLFRMGIYMSLVAGVVIFEMIFNSFVPGCTGDMSHDRVILGSAFVKAYYLGGIFCIVSLVFSLLGRSRDQQARGDIPREAS